MNNKCAGNAVNNDIQNKNEVQEKVGAKAIEPAQALLEDMYKMGFPLELSKQALISIKNSSIEDAIEKVTALQEEEIKKGNNQPARGNTKNLKPAWNCSACTLENLTKPDTDPICDACGTLGDSAYYTIEELDAAKTEETKKLEARN